jgi:hypothetical protein
MLRTWITLSVAGLLIFLGLAIAGYKYTFLSFPLFPKETFKSWYVELNLTVDPSGSRTAWRKRPPLELEVLRPGDSSRYAVANLQMIARGFGETKVVREEDNQPVIRLTKRSPKPLETAQLRFVLYDLDVNEQKSQTPPKYDSPYLQRNRISNPEESQKILYDEIDTLSQKAQELSSSPTSFTRELHKALREDENSYDFLLGNTESQDMAALLVTLLHANEIPARVVNGLALKDEESHIAFLRWVEVYHDNKWQRFDLELGEFGSKDGYFHWWTGNSKLVTTQQVDHIKIDLAMKANRDDAFTRALWLSEKEKGFIHKIALQTLPLNQQIVLQFLLLLPLGALIVSFLRQVIGVQTFGTFMPVLVALAFRETGLLYGVIFFMSLITIGSIARRNLETLRLLMVPRLSAVLTIVVLMITLFMLYNKDHSVPLGISVALFPVIILTMFIERMSTVIEEQGKKAAYTGCAGSMIVACMIYLLIMNDRMKHIMFTFPELLLVTLGACLMLGRYNGYKLTEYWRFRHLERAFEAQDKQV